MQGQSARTLARPVNREFGREDFGIRVRLRALANGVGGVVHPNLATNSVFGDRVQCVGEGSVATFHARNCEGMVFADDIVRAPDGRSPNRSCRDDHG